MKIGSVDVEEFSRNLARLVEEGGRALAAYLKPREEGRKSSAVAEEVAEVLKTLGHVAEYWLEDPQRALEVQTRLGKAYLDLWASAVKRLAGEPATPVVTPDKSDKRFADPEWSANQFYDFLKQAYLLTTQWANRLVTDAADLDPHTKQKAEFYVRQIGNALSRCAQKSHSRKQHPGHRAGTLVVIRHALRVAGTASPRPRVRA